VFITMSTWPGADAAERLHSAVLEVERAVLNNPTDPPLRYQLADLLISTVQALEKQAGAAAQPERAAELRARVADTTAQARQEAQEALRLDDITLWAGRKLSSQERSRLKRWLEP
jgi:hypothetical protein